MSKPLGGRVAVVAGATRGAASNGLCCQLPVDWPVPRLSIDEGGDPVLREHSGK